MQSLLKARFSVSQLNKLNELGLTNLKSIQLERPQRYAWRRSRSFKVGDQPPEVYTEVYEYPKDFKPWTLNYTGHGAFIAMVGLCWYGYFQYENGYLRRTERDERPQRKQHYI